MRTRIRQSSYAVRIPASVLSHGGLIASQLCFSSFHVVAALVVTDPLSFALWREMLSCVIMLAYARASRKSSIEFPNKDWVVFIVCGVLNFTNVVGSLFALYYLSPSRFAIMQPLIPVFSAALSLKTETFSSLQIGGIVLACVGAVIVQFQAIAAEQRPQDNAPLGYTITTVQCASMASFLVMQRDVLAVDGFHSGSFSFLCYGIGTLFTLVIFLSSWTPSSSFFPTEGKLVGALLFSAIFPTAFAFNSFAYAGQHLSPSTIATYTALQPLFTASLSLIFLGTGLSLGEVLGGLIVIAGLVVTVRNAPVMQQPFNHVATCSPKLRALPRRG